MTAHYISALNQPIFPNVDGNLNSFKLLGLTLLKTERLNTQPGGMVKSSLRGVRKFKLSVKPI